MLDAGTLVFSSRKRVSSDWALPSRCWCAPGSQPPGVWPRVGGGPTGVSESISPNPALDWAWSAH